MKLCLHSALHFLPWSLINLTQWHISSDCPLTLTLFCLFTPSSFLLYLSFFFYYNSFIFLYITFYSHSCFILSAFIQQFFAYSLFHCIIPYSSCFVYRCSSDSTELVNGLADHRIRVRFVTGTDFSKRLDLMGCERSSFRHLETTLTETQLGRTPPLLLDISHRFVSYPPESSGARGGVVVKTLRNKPAGSIPDGVIGIFQWHNPSSRTMALGSTQPLTEVSTRCISWE